MMKNKDLYRIAISIGDINGIGLEIIFKALEKLKGNKNFIPVIFGPSNTIKHVFELFESRLKLHFIQSEEQAEPNFINVLDRNYKNIYVKFGENRPEAGELAFLSLKHAAESVRLGKCDALVTAPINKNNIQSEEFRFPGHTEFLENIWVGKSLMFMVHPQIKVGLVTNHLPVKEIAKNITQQRIEQKIELIFASLKKDFGIVQPKIAVLALNPHAGDNGILGEEENKIIIPAIKEKLEKNRIVFGPFPADSFFTASNLSKFDAILAMYHDQGLASFKSLAGLEGVNFTAGLDYVRTSPDHGVAYDIAGENKADAKSMEIAIETAVQILNHRKSISE